MSKFFYLICCVWMALPLGADLKGYLLPKNHAIIKTLDKVFHQSSLLKSRNHLISAGFIPTEHQGANSLTLRHPKLKGYIVKVLTDGFPLENEWERFKLRIDGERLVRVCVKQHRWEKVFKIPRQWIYMLPYPSPKRKTIIIAEDAEILPHHLNVKWYRDKMTKEILRKIFILTTEVGLQDCCRKTNLPRTRDGRLAVIDTETFHSWPVEYPRLLSSLNPTMQQAWFHIIQEQSND